MNDNKPVAIVICGSFKNHEEIRRFAVFLKRIIRFNGGDLDVYPTQEHIDNSMPLIKIHHNGEGQETEQTYELRHKMMTLYFKAIEESKMVIIYNLKDGLEHIGSGALMELGYAHALEKDIWFLVKPTDDNVLSMFKGQPNIILGGDYAEER
jgi:hypothetical protein